MNFRAEISFQSEHLLTILCSKACEKAPCINIKQIAIHNPFLDISNLLKRKLLPPFVSMHTTTVFMKIM
jgi:hypothetical protein